MGETRCSSCILQGKTPSCNSITIIVIWCALVLTSSASIIDYNCVYSNSTRPCSSICPQGCFYPLLPSTCSEEGQMLLYSNDSRPLVTSSSVIINETYAVPTSIVDRIPNDLFQDDSSYTIAFWVKLLEITQSSKVLIQLQFSTLNAQFIIYVKSSWLYVTNGTIDDINSFNTTAQLQSFEWHLISTVVENSNSTSMIMMYVNGSLAYTVSFSIIGSSANVTDIYLGGLGSEDSSGLADGDIDESMMDGLMSDVGIFSRQLTGTDIMDLINRGSYFSNVNFLPQCLCPDEVRVNLNDIHLCDDNTTRYDIDSHAVDFITDNDLSTHYESNTGHDVISVVLEFKRQISLSKILIDLVDVFPDSLRLQYYSDLSSTWKDLKFFAVNCTESFGVDDEDFLSSINDTACQQVNLTTTNIGFYVVVYNDTGIGADELKATFVTSFIRFIISSSSSVVKISRVQVCVDFNANFNDVPKCLSGQSIDASSSIASSTPIDDLISSTEVASTIDEVAMGTSLFLTPSPTIGSIFLISEFSTIIISSSELSSNVFTSSNSIIEESLFMATSSVAISDQLVMSSPSSLAFMSTISGDNLLTSEVEQSLFQSSTVAVEVSITDQLSSSDIVISSSVGDVISSSLTTESMEFSLINSVISTDEPITTITISPSSVGESEMISITAFIQSSEEFSSTQIELAPSITQIFAPTSVIELETSSLEVEPTEIASSTELEEFSSTQIELAPSITQIFAPTSVIELETSSLEVEPTEIASSTELEEFSSTQIELAPSITQIFTPTSVIELETSSLEVEPTEIVSSTELEEFSSTQIELAPSITEVFTPTSAVELETSSLEVEPTELVSSTELEEFSSTQIEFAPSITQIFTPTSVIELETSSLEVEPTEIASSTELEEFSSTQIEFAPSITEVFTPTSVIELETSSLEVEPTEIASSTELEEFSSTQIEFAPSITEVFTPTSVIELETSSLEVEPTEIVSSTELEEFSSTQIEIAPSITEVFTPTSVIELETSSFEVEPAEIVSSTELEEFSSTQIELAPSITQIFTPTSVIELETSSLEVEPTEIASSTELEEFSSTQIEFAPSITEVFTPTSAVELETSSFEVEPTELVSSTELEEFSSTQIEFAPSITEVFTPTSVIELETSSLELEPTELVSSTELEEFSSTVFPSPTLAESFSSFVIEETSSIIIVSSERIFISSSIELELSSTETSIISSFEFESPSSAEQFISFTPTSIFIQPSPTVTGEESSTVLEQFSSIELFSSFISESPTPVSPSPTIATSIIPSPTFMSIPVTPTVLVNGLGLLVDSPQQINDNTTQYNFTYGIFGAQTSNETTGTIKAQIGHFTTEEKTFTYLRHEASTIYGLLSTRRVWIDNPALTVAVQCRDSFGSTRIMSTDVTIIGTHSFSGQVNYTCSISDVTESGSCNRTVSIPPSWFNTDNNTKVSFTAMVDGSSIQAIIGNVSLSPSYNMSINSNILYISLPMADVYPGDELLLSVVSSFDHKVFGFNIDCNISGVGGEIINVSSPNQYSLLHSFYQNQTNRIAMSGFRNRDQFDTSLVHQSQILVTLSVLLPSYDNYSISCSSVGLSLTTREVIIPNRTNKALPIQVISRDGNVSDIGVIATTSNDVVGIFPYVMTNTFLNLATVTGTSQSLGRISSLALYSNGTLITLHNPNELNCISTDEFIIKVHSDCTDLYFDGSETNGSIVNILASHGGVSGSLPVAVWILGTSLTLSLQDPILNMTQSCNYHQNTSVTISGNISHDNTSHSVVLTSLLQHLLQVENSSIASVDDNGNIIGLSSGSTNVYIREVRYGYAPVIVSDEIANPLYLSLFAYSDVELDVMSGMIDAGVAHNGIVQILQSFRYISQPVYVDAVIVYDDGSTAGRYSDIQLSVGDSLMANGGIYHISSDMASLPVINGLFRTCDNVNISGSVNIDVNLLAPSEIKIIPSSEAIALSDDLLVLQGLIPSYATLNITAIYPDSAFISPILPSSITNITTNDSSIVNVTTESSVIAVRPLAEGIAMVTVHIGEYNITGAVNISVLSSDLRLFLRPYPSYNMSDMTVVSSISRIGDSPYYQRVIAHVVLHALPYGTNHTILNPVINTSDNLISDGSIISVNGVSDGGVIGTVTVNVNGTIASANISILNDSVSVTSVEVEFMSRFIAVSGTQQIANCKVFLSDGSILPRAFDISSGIPIYGDVVTISTSNSGIARVIDNTSRVELLRTSFDRINISCVAAPSNIINSQPLVCNTLPDNGQIDLGNNDGLPLLLDDAILDVPLTLSSNVSVGVFQIEMSYQPNFVSFVSSDQGSSWFNGSIIATQVNTGRLLVGGVLNSGVEGELLQLVNLKFKLLNNNSNISFEANLSLLAEASLSLIDIIDTSTSASLKGLPTGNQRAKRESEDDDDNDGIRTRREAEMCPPYPLGDINGDCRVNLKDVYYFQEYNLAIIHGSSGSSDAMTIFNNIESKNITLDVDGDGIVTLDDVVYTEQITSGLVYDISATYSITKSFCDCILSINITISTVNGDPVNTDNLHVFGHFAQAENTFINETKFSSVIEEVKVNQGLHTAVVRANLSRMMNDDATSVYTIEAYTSSFVNNIGVSFIQAISDGNGEFVESRVSGLFGDIPLTPQDDSSPFVISVNVTQSQSISLAVDQLLPHFIINLTCPDDLPPSIPPSLPLMANTNGMAYVVGNIRPVDESSNIRYVSKVAVLGNKKRLGNLSVSLNGGDGVGSTLYYAVPSHGEVILHQPNVIFNEAEGIVHAIVQVVDEEYISRSELVNVSLYDDDNDDLIMMSYCISDEVSGLCNVTFNLFDSQIRTNLSIKFSSSNVNKTINISTARTLSPLAIPVKGIAMVTPPYPISPDVTFNVSVHSNTSYSLISFVLRVNLPSCISIDGVYSSDKLWGVKCSNDGLCIGYNTHFQTASTSSLLDNQNLFILSLSPSSNCINGKPLTISGTLHELHNVFYQDVTNDSQFIIIDGFTGNEYANNINITIQSIDTVKGLYLYTEETVLVNTAVLDGQMISIFIHIGLLYSNGSVVMVTGSTPSCHMIDGDGALQYTSDCSSVYLNGSETNGSDRVTYNVSLGRHSSMLIFKVWFPAIPVKLSLANNVLKAIHGAYDVNCNQSYQSTIITALTNMSAGNDTLYDVDVSRMIIPNISVSPQGVASLNVTSHVINGLTKANSVTLTSHKSESITFSITDEPVSIRYLYTAIVNDITITSSSFAGNIFTFVVTLHHINDTGDYYTLALFDDDSTMPATGYVTYTPSAMSGLSTEWRNTSPSCGLTCVKVDVLDTSPTNISYTLSVVLTPDSTYIAESQAIADILSIPAHVRAAVMLVDDADGSHIDVTDSTLNSHSLPSTHNTVNLNSQLIGNHSNVISFTYNLNGFILSTNVTIHVVMINTSTSLLELFLYPSGGCIDTLRSIKGTSIYEKATVNGTIAFTNEAVMDLSSINPSLYQLVPSHNAITIQSNTITVNSPSVPNDVIISLTLANNTINVTSVSLELSNSSVPITGISWPSNFLSLVGRVNAKISLDVSVNLSSYVIPSLRDFAGNSFVSLIQFTSNNTSIVSIDSDNMDAILHGNSYCDGVELTAHVNSSSPSLDASISPTVSLLPEPFGLSLRAPHILLDSPYKVLSVYVNTGGHVVNAIQANVVFDESELHIHNVSIRDSQWPGGTFLYNTQPAGNGMTQLMIGGLSLNEGLYGDDVHVTDVFLTTTRRSFNVLYSYISDLILDNYTAIDRSLMVNGTCRGTMNDISYDDNSCNDTFPCPVNVSLSAQFIRDRLNQSMETFDIDFDGINNTLDGLYATQVSFGLLGLLKDLPQVINSSRDFISDRCAISFNVPFTSYDGREANGLNVYYLIDISDRHNFSSLFNANNAIDTSSLPYYDESRVIMMATNDQVNKDYRLSLDTSVMNIPPGVISVSVIQMGGNNSSPASILPMVKHGTTQKTTLNVSIDDNIVYVNGYNPLTTAGGISCPPIVLMIIGPINSTSTTFQFNIMTNITAIPDITLMLYICNEFDCHSNVSSFTSHDDFNVISDGNNAGQFTVFVYGLSPFTAYEFYIARGNVRVSDIRNITTDEAKPVGFTDSHIMTSTGPNFITVSWTNPDEPNGRIISAVIVVKEVENSNRKRRAIDDIIRNETLANIGSYNITDLTIATTYAITIILLNSVGDISATVTNSTTFPPPTITYTNGSMDGCVNITINHPYITDNVAVQYIINFTCKSNGITNETKENNITTNGITETICYDTFNNFECDGEYTVIVNIFRNGFVNSNMITISNIPIIRPTTSTSLFIISLSSTDIQSLPTSMILSMTSMMLSPSSTVSSPTVSSPTAPSPTVSSPTAPSSTAPSPTVSSPTAPSPTVSSPTVSSPTVSSPTAPSPTVSSPTVSSPMASSSMVPSPTDTPGGGDQIPVMIGGALAGIILILIVILGVTVVIAVCFMTRKKGSVDFYHRPGSRTSKDYWFEVEENVEMSPIDIVPVDHNHTDELYIDETVMSSGVIENKNVYSNEDIPSREASLSSKPLINHIKPQRRTVTFTAESEGPPPPYTGESMKHTNRTYDEDSESLIDLNFHDDVVSQPYLSLGLTPLSQLSPDPLASSGQNDVGFFPSMLPPVSPLYAGAGISVDPEGHGMDSLVMPDAFPIQSSNDSTKRTKRQQKTSENNLLNGNYSGSRTLEPLIEQRSLEVDDMGLSSIGYSKSTNSRGSSLALRNLTSMDDRSSSNSPEEGPILVFPSATTDSPLVHRKVSKDRPPSLTFQDDFIDDNFQSSSQLTRFKQQDHGGMGYLNNNFETNETKHRRQMERAKAIADQKAKLVEQKRLEEESKKLARSREIRDSIAKSYKTDDVIGGGIVLQKIARFDAQAEINQEENNVKRNKGGSQDMSPLANKYPPNIFASPQHRWTTRPRQPSTDSIDMEVTDNQFTAL